MKAPAGLALIIAEKLKGKMKEKEEEKTEVPQAKDIAEELIQAIGNKDSDAVLKAFEALHTHFCPMDKEDEEDDSEEETDEEE